MLAWRRARAGAANHATQPIRSAAPATASSVPRMPIALTRKKPASSEPVIVPSVFQP